MVIKVPFKSSGAHYKIMNCIRQMRDEGKLKLQR